MWRTHYLDKILSLEPQLSYLIAFFMLTIILWHKY